MGGRAIREADKKARLTLKEEVKGNANVSVTKRGPLSVASGKPRANTANHSNVKTRNQLLFQLKSLTWGGKEEIVLQNTKQSKLNIFKFKRQLSTHERKRNNSNTQLARAATGRADTIQETFEFGHTLWPEQFKYAFESTG